ncbi:MAG TPA: phosphoenolpyruvate carboxykinase, partial [Acholeplasmataceae bacterium]|nr:phosphoenolpyruvate carboxykinase [Acholeplasmataceae bacterium]
ALEKVPSVNKKHIKPLYNLVENFYDYWRNLQRYGLVKGSKNYDPNIKVADLMMISQDFNSVVISIYRTITQKLLGSNFHVYRQLPAGTNANMLYIKHRFTTEKTYQNIQNIAFVTKIITSPPFIINSKSNTRTGIFTEIKENPLTKIKIIKDHFIAFPIKVGPLLAFVYIHRDFLHHGMGLSNLFEFANYKDFKNRKPDLIYLYGISENEFDGKYYLDNDNNCYVGFVSRDDKNDYFGYLKKMLLTLHNVYMIKNNNLPIHGAMVRIVLSNNTIKNVAIIGDSGAGKSETLEALRIIGQKQIKDMKVVFDDMGTFKIKNNEIVANGTEIGAFVRLDDLDTGYAYQIMDRALFMNPNKVNARVVNPISTYDFIMSNHKIDFLFYANNYEENTNGIEFFENIEDAISVFRKGVRKAKGTTSEVGLVESYFANPFGPVQLENDTEILLNKYFNKLKDDGTIIGEIYTMLAISGKETDGPLNAAKKLLEYISRN